MLRGTVYRSKDGDFKVDLVSGQTWGLLACKGTYSEYPCFDFKTKRVFFDRPSMFTEKERNVVFCLFMGG